MPSKFPPPEMPATEMLARLISFDTTSDRSNLPLIDFVRDWLDTNDVPYRLSFDPTGQKANLHATIGPVEAGGIAFSGHVDTVSASGQAWTGDPYVLRCENGHLIGRGTCDMKGFLAGMLASVPYIRARRPTRPVHILLTYDEEVGYHGARRLIEDIAESGLRPDGCLIGEATGMRPIVAHRGRFIVRATVHGHMAHSSEAHRGVNAVHEAAAAIAWIEAESRRLAAEGPFADGFDPNFSLLQVTDFGCRSLPNSVPGEAAFQFEWRNVPGEDPHRALAALRDFVATAIEPGMRARWPEAGFAFEVLLDLGAVAMKPDHELARAATAITGVAAGTVNYCSEGSLFQQAGIPSMVCGPGNLGQVHRPDEWIEEDQLIRCQDFVRRVVDRVAV